jgi:N-acetylneuraminate synthase
VPKLVRIGGKSLGESRPVYIVGEIGINHNGDLRLALELIDVAARAGCDAVKFQKRTPELCVPVHQRAVMRDTPWGHMTYLDYRQRVEFGEEDYARIAAHCRRQGIDWFASCWDQPSVELMEQFQPVCYKIASASLTDDELLTHVNSKGRPMLLSTGMSTMAEIGRAVSLLDRDRLIILHATSSYPCPPESLNLKMIPELKRRFDCPIGYSGHEVGLQTTVAAVALGACVVERHITLDRAMWGTDQAASVEPGGLVRLVRDIRNVEKALGDGVKRVYASELSIREKLRRAA